MTLPGEAVRPPPDVIFVLIREPSRNGRARRGPFAYG